MMDFNIKIKNLKKRLKKFDKVLVAFSGGKDSFFLLKMTIESLGKKNVFPVFIKTEFTSKNDEKRVQYFKKKLKFDLIKMNINILNKREIKLNPRNRCYICKRFIFSTLKKKAKELGINTILDGTSFSDLDEFRPGLRALEELQIVSPLKETKISSSEIIKFLRSCDIEEYYLTSSTCLATRFPYDIKLDQKMVEKFDRLEAFFIKNDLYPVRVRYIPEGIRIEIDERNFKVLLGIKEKIIMFCKKMDFKIVSLDLEGIKSGIWD
jgi:uncharacterized protein